LQICNIPKKNHKTAISKGYDNNLSLAKWRFLLKNLAPNERFCQKENTFCTINKCKPRAKNPKLLCISLSSLISIFTDYFIFKRMDLVGAKL